MLTCAKGSLVFSTPDFMKSKLSRRHGISTNNDFKNSLDLNTEAVQVSGDGVYSLVRAALGFEPLSASSSTQVQHILTRLPEVDGWYRLLFGKDSYQPDEYPYYWRVFETEDEYFDYYRDYHAFWKLYGIGLPDAVLKKLYFANALRITPGLPYPGA